MNKKIIIQGRNVHHVNVGYRPFLLRKVRELGIPNYDAKNVKEEYCLDRVVVSLGGEEKQLQEFVEFAKENRPPKAIVAEVKEAEPPEYVMPIDEYDKQLAAEQQDTIVQTGLMMLDKQDELKMEMHSLREETNQNFTTLREDYLTKSKISKNLRTEGSQVGRISEIMENMAKSLEKMADKS